VVCRGALSVLHAPSQISIVTCHHAQADLDHNSTRDLHRWMECSCVGMRRFAKVS
jgi:hypothetical protein